MSSLYSPDPRYATPPRRRRSRAGVGVRQVLGVVFLLAGAFLLLFGFSSLGAGLLLREAPLPDALAWQAPPEQIKTADLAPASVLVALTGVSGADALNAALNRGHWENAYAVIAYDTTLSDPARIGSLLQLGTRYAAARDKSKAFWCYWDAARIATISPMLSDAVREDTYLQVATGLLAIGAKDAARLATDQAYLVAQYSQVLRRDPQSRRLTQVADAYAALGADALATQARARAAEPFTLPEDPAGYLPRDPFVVKADDLVLAPEVKNAVQGRVAAAKQLSTDIADIPANRASDWPTDSVKQLRDTLVQEDRARLAFYDREIVLTKEPALQVAILRDKVDWLALKTRIARGAFGADLVPDWSRESARITDAWNDAWGDLFRQYEGQAVAIPNAQAVTQATEDVVRQQLLAVRWGWYRGASEQDLHTTLGDLTQQLSNAKVASLRLDLILLRGKNMDLLLPDELYGQGETALPSPR